MQKSQTLNDSRHDLLEPTRREAFGTQILPEGGIQAGTREFPEAVKARTSLFRGLQTEVCMPGNYESPFSLTPRVKQENVHAEALREKEEGKGVRSASSLWAKRKKVCIKQ